MFDARDTNHEDLRGGRSPWHTGQALPRRQLDADRRCGVLVVGAGITGALAAEHLTALGHDVCIVDRERPGLGSTAASTAMLLWEIDRPLAALTRFYGFDRAAAIYRRSLQTVAALNGHVRALGLSCHFRDRKSLYLAADPVGARELLAEHALRQRAGLPGDYLDYRGLRASFGFDREAAILSPGAADADPLCLARELVATAIARGAAFYDADAVGYETGGTRGMVTLDNGHTIEADWIVLATGYVMPDFVRIAHHSLSSSWALATPPQPPAARWPDDLLLWEACEDYLYARTTADHRIIIGGEDDSALIDPAQRDAAMPAKARTLLSKLALLWPAAQPTTQPAADFVWSGVFGKTPAGLPLIGAVPGHPRALAAYGYGGNGITFSFLASRMLGQIVAGQRESWHDDFALDRPQSHQA